ncbi:MAG: Eco57I restriction-modification methylase domain-containing protein, partial [Nannocystaceae bacterium]
GVDEYYTPPPLALAIGRAVARLIQDLAGTQEIRCLEPSAGIGNLVRGIELGCPRVAKNWTLVEPSTEGAKILRILRASDKIATTSFETWAKQQAPGCFNVVVANPPFSERGLSTDLPAQYREGAAYAYFLRQALDLLAAGGLAIFVLPASFLSSEVRRDLRGRVLSRGRLVQAWRLPRRIFPGVDMHTDLVVLKARAGVHPVAPDEQYIADGDYFDKHPGQILSGKSVEIPEIHDECTSCNSIEIHPQEEEAPQAPTVDAGALALGRRIRDLQAACSEDSPRAHGLWVELLRDIEDFLESEFLAKQGKRNPWGWGALKGDGATEYRHAFMRRGDLAVWLQQGPPRPSCEYRGDPDNLTNQATWLYHRDGHLTAVGLLSLHRSVGGQLDLDAIQTLPGWVLVGENELQPDDVFFSGDLWARLDMLDPTAGEIQREQIERLHRLIAAVPLEDIDELTPRAGWMPVEILTHWLNEVIDRDFSGTAPLTLARQSGRIVIAGIDYEDTRAAVPAELGDLLGWLNYETLKGSQDWASDFAAWASEVHERRHAIASAYNRRVRGYRCRQFSPDPLTLPRWGDLRLHPYQVAAVHQVLEARCGLLAFDAGLGKTYAALAILAAARRDGEARR